MAIRWVKRPFSIQTTTGSSATVSEETGTTADKRIITVRTVTDDGAGNFGGALGTVDYTGKTLQLKVVSHDRSTTSYKADHEDAAEFSRTVADGSGSSSGDQRKGGEYATTAIGEQMLAASSVRVRYRTGVGAPRNVTQTYQPEGVTIDLCPYTSDRIVPGSVRFAWMGTVYEDVEGVLYRERDGNSPGIVSGSIDYATGHAVMTDYVVGGGGATDFTLLSLWTQKGAWRTASVFFMTGASPIQPGQITITLLDAAGTQIHVDCDLAGNLSGPHARGKFEFQNGLAELQFGDYVDNSTLTDDDKAEWWYNPADVGAVEPGRIWRPWPIDPASLRYNAVSNLYLPVDPQILGLNPVRLPQDGRVPIFRKGRVVVIGHNAALAPATYSNGQTIDLGRTRVSHVWLIDADGKLIEGGYSATEQQLDAGQITVTDTTGWAQPVTVEHRIQDMRLCTDVQIDGTLGVNFPLSHDFPAGSVVSSALLFGTIFARVSNVFDQQSWDGTTWADAPVGNEATATYNAAAYPLRVTNAGALGERYALRFNSDATTFQLIGQFSGGLGQGNKNAPFAPANPFNPAVPLFELDEAGWGSGWVAGNTLFVKLEAAMPAMALIRTVQPGEPTGIDYAFDVLLGGDIDRPPSAP